MKKYIFSGVIIAFVILLFTYLGKTTSNFLEKRKEVREANIADTIPNEYLKLFDVQQINQFKGSTTTYHNTEFPICIVNYMKLYEIVISKKTFDTTKVVLDNLLKKHHPLKHRTINLKQCQIFEGFVNLYFAVDTNKFPLDSLTITMPQEGKFTKEFSNEKGIGYVISNCMEFNLFYRQAENPDVKIELSNQLFGRRNTNIGLLLKQVENVVYYIFILPINAEVTPISKDLLQSLI